VTLIVLLATALFVAACWPVPEIGAPLTLKIGLVAPFEGLYRPLGYEALFGVKLALQEKNETGGLKGYRVELVALNDFDEPAEASVQAQALVADPYVLGVVGHLSAGATGAALPVYEQANMAVSIPWPAVAADRSGGVVNIAADSTVTEAYLANVIEIDGYTNVIQLTSDDRTIPQSGDIEAIELATGGVTAGEILLALQSSGISVPVFGQVEAGSPQLLPVAGEAANGLIYVSPGPAPTDVGATDFIESYQALAGFPPGPRAVLAYDSAHVLLAAIEQAMPADGARPTRAEVSQTISTVRRRGLSGDIAFDAHGRRVEAPVWLYRIFDEEYPGALLAP
jgi:branched-chain amino acid transport system substrate-binding protein